MSTLSEWENELHKKFLELDFKKDIIPVIRKCYEIAMSDAEKQNEYTDLVLKNILFITNKKPMTVTFKQWKSFNAYIKSSNPIISIDKSKLYN